LFDSIGILNWWIALLAGLPSRYRDSVRAIRPGLPLFLYNYSTHQLHGIFEVQFFFLLSDLLAIRASFHCFRITEISSHAGRKLRRIQHRSNSLGGQEMPRRVPFPRSGINQNSKSSSTTENSKDSRIYCSSFFSASLYKKRSNSYSSETD